MKGLSSYEEEEHSPRTENLYAYAAEARQAAVVPCEETKAKLFAVASAESAPSVTVIKSKILLICPAPVCAGALGGLLPAARKVNR